MKLPGDNLVASCGLMALLRRAPFCPQTIKKSTELIQAINLAQQDEYKGK
jgi:hypothetical protein